MCVKILDLYTSWMLLYPSIACDLIAKPLLKIYVIFFLAAYACIFVFHELFILAFVAPAVVIIVVVVVTVAIAWIRWEIFKCQFPNRHKETNNNNKIMFEKEKKMYTNVPHREIHLK